MNLFYRSSGKGTPVVILHGLYGSSDNWMQVSKMLSENYHVIAVDQRNHGASPHSNDHTYNDMVTDLAWLLHDLEIEKVHVIGHSMGGKVAMAFAADYPEKILSLTVADIAPKNYLKTPASALQHGIHKKILNTLDSFDLSAFSTRKEVDQQLKFEIKERFIRQFILKNLKRENQNFEWKINVPVLKSHLNHIIGGIDIEDYSDRIPITQYPVLFIKGELSGYIQDEDFELIKKMYPDAKIEVISGTTHFLHAEKPEEFTHILREFLKNL